MAVKRVRAFCIWIWRGFNEIVVTGTWNIHFPAQDAQFLHQQFTNFAPGWDNICTWEWSKSIFLLESPHAAASKILCTGICTLFRAHWQLDVAACFPDIAAEWHPSLNGNITPEMVLPHSNKSAWWICKGGHEWQAKINNRTSGETGCPICNGNGVPKSERDLNTMFPEIAKQWHPVLNGELKPTDMFPMSNRRVWWICAHKHVWQSKVYHRVEGRGCPYCCGQKPIVGRTDLATLAPELAAQWHPTKNEQLQPSDVTLKSHKCIWWICEKGHEWQATVTDRVAGRGCPVCHNHKILEGYNDLQTVVPELAAQWHPNKNGDLSPSMVLPHHNGRVWWICEKGHEWQASPNNRMAGCGCPFCNQHRLIPEETSLAAVRPDIAAQWDYEKNAPDTPNDVTAYSNKKYWWRCNVGHHWIATVANRSYGKECPDCLNRKRRNRRYLS